MTLEIIIWTTIISGVVLGLIDALRPVKKAHHFHVMRVKCRGTKDTATESDK